MEGDPKDLPPAVTWPDGWQIQPDVIVKGPVVEIPAHPKNDVIEWMSVTVPTGFAKDTWITSVQIKPEHPAVAHHICLGFNAHTPDVKYFDSGMARQGARLGGQRDSEQGSNIWPRFGRWPFHKYGRGLLFTR